MGAPTVLAFLQNQPLSVQLLQFLPQLDELIVFNWSEAVCVCVCVLLHLSSCEDKFVQERGVARLWEVARCDLLLPRN